MMESLTAALVEQADAIVAEVEAMGGMARAVATGMPKRRIEEAATRKQAVRNPNPSPSPNPNPSPSPNPNPNPNPNPRYFMELDAFFALFGVATYAA